MTVPLCGFAFAHPCYLRFRQSELLDQGELGTVGVDKVPGSKTPFLHMHRVQSWHPGCRLGHTGATNGVVQLIYVGNSEATHEIA